MLSQLRAEVKEFTRRELIPDFTIPLVPAILSVGVLCVSEVISRLESTTPMERCRISDELAGVTT